MQMLGAGMLPGDLRREAKGLVVRKASHLRIAGTIHEQRHACSVLGGGQQVKAVMTTRTG